MHRPSPALGLVVLLAAACPTVDLGESPVTPDSCRPDPMTFETRVWPEALAPAGAGSCIGEAGCHARDTGRSALRLIPSPTTPADWAMNYEVVTRFLNCSTPRASTLITKPASGGDPHAGGELWTPGVAPATTVEEWISGAL